MKDVSHLDGILQSTLGVHKSSFNEVVGGFELLIFGIVRFTKQVFGNCCQSLELLKLGA